MMDTRGLSRSPKAGRGVLSNEPLTHELDTESLEAELKKELILLEKAKAEMERKMDGIRLRLIELAMGRE